MNSAQRKGRSILAAIALAFAISSPAFHGCSTPPSQRVAAVNTLKSIGAAADAAMRVAAGAYHDGRLTAAQWAKIAEAHDRFQALYNVAVAGVQANLDSIASPDLVSLAAQLADAVRAFLPDANLQSISAP